MTSPRAPFAVVAAAVLLSACPGRQPPETCDGVSARSSSATAVDRWLLGQASRYPADNSLAARADELHRSQRARRAAAWEAIARTLAPVPLAHPTGVADATVPRFRTWYDRQDVYRMFSRLYGSLSIDARRAREHFSDSALDEAFGFDATFATTLPEWPADRLAAYATGLDGLTSIAAIGGVQRIAISPDAARHTIASYPEIMRCMTDGAPPAFESTPIAPRRLAREQLSLGRCGTQTVGPFFVANGGQLRATLEGTGADGAQIAVVEGVTSDAVTRCNAEGSHGCITDGPGIFSVRVTTQGRDMTGMLDVEYSPPTPAIAGCLNGVFPSGAATVAQEWRRTDIGIPFPTYDTSAAGLARRLAPGADATWGMGDGTADPSASEAYTLQLASGGTFRLAGMHIRTRELDHWLNITLWWSPNPDEDFGADRSASVRALGAPWTSYKMCVATEFDEQDTHANGGFDADAPTLAAALAAVHEGQGGPSWCSNPYIDGAPGLVRSNCVGCHQHAMSGLRPGDIQTDPVHYPGNGRLQVRNNFPSDQFWGIDAGDQLGASLNEIIAAWDSMP